jgi:hypothetical protein
MKIQSDEEVGFERVDIATIPRRWRCSCGATGLVEFSRESQRIRCTVCNSLTFQTLGGTIRRVK